jgi:hypothetical protein
LKTRSRFRGLIEIAVAAFAVLLKQLFLRFQDLRSDFRGRNETFVTPSTVGIKTTEAASAVAMRPQKPNIWDEYLEQIGEYDAIFKWH